MLLRKDYIVLLQFIVVAAGVLWLVPNQAYGPYGVFNPYQIAWMVFIISGVSLLGYLILKLAGRHVGLILVGLLGGVISTTATTLVYARHSRRSPEFSAAAAYIILLSHLTLFVRTTLITCLVNIKLIAVMLPWLLGGFLMGIIYLLGFRQTLSHQFLKKAVIDFGYSLEIYSTITFTFIFVIVMWLVAWVNDVFSDMGVYIVSFFSGLADIDAITLSHLKLAAVQGIHARTVMYSVFLAFVANLLFKLAIIFLVGDKNLRKPVGTGFLCLVVGAGLGIIFKQILS